MKDKSRFISSIIVSLLAGFIYYQFGENIKDIQSSVKAVLSYSDADMEFTIPPQSFSSGLNKSVNKSTKKRSKFYIRKRNTIEFKTKDATIPGDELFSDLVSGTQAKIQRPTPDKNIDFAAELQHLVKGDLTKAEHPGRQIKGSKSLSTTTYEVADVNSTKTRTARLRDNFEKSQKEYRLKNYKGRGFEYNYIIEENSSGSSKNSKETTNTCKTKCEQKKIKTTNKVKVENKTSNGQKIKVKVPKARGNSDSDVEEININIPVSSSEEVN